MQIIIPTYRRVDRQATFEHLPDYWKARTVFVADNKDTSQLKKLYKKTDAEFVIHPAEVNTIAKKRAWIIKNPVFDKILMLDDDLHPFSKREDGGLKKASPLQITRALLAVKHKLDEYVHVGISPRLGNHLVPDGGWVENTRMIYALGYRAAVVRKVCKLGRVELREDMELTLQLLKKGYNNAVLYDLAFEQARGYDSEGGMSAEGRSVEQSNQQALKLAQLHPGLVTVVKKDYKTSTQRWEVIVHWKKAVKLGREKKRGFFHDGK